MPLMRRQMRGVMQEDSEFSITLAALTRCPSYCVARGVRTGLIRPTHRRSSDGPCVGSQDGVRFVWYAEEMMFHDKFFQGFDRFILLLNRRKHRSFLQQRSQGLRATLQNPGPQ